MKNELINLIKSLNREADWKSFYKDLFNEHCDNFENESDIEEVLIKNGFLIKTVDQYGGEGKGDYCWCIFSVEHDGAVSYFKIAGTYSSYNGARMIGNHFDFYEVEKIPVQTFEWRKVNKKT